MSEGLNVALIWHPDKVEASKRDEAEEMFKNIKEAYDILSDGTKPVVMYTECVRGKTQIV
jgi:DnaJ-class molecular chaperone